MEAYPSCLSYILSASSTLSTQSILVWSTCHLHEFLTLQYIHDDLATRLEKHMVKLKLNHLQEPQGSQKELSKELRATV